MDCLFCKIIGREIPAQIVHEDDVTVVFPDIHPKARVHLLIVLKKHIPTIADLQDGDEKIMGHLMRVAQKVAQDEKLSGYRLQFNIGKDGGQEIFHIHCHLLAN